MFYLIGLGLSKGDISVKGFEIIKRCDSVYAEFYTSFLSDLAIDKFEKEISKKIRLLSRDEIETDKKFLDEAKKKDVALLVGGDALAATTHIELVFEAEKKGIKTKIIHAPSIYSAVGETGLQLYKFGKTLSIPFWSGMYKPDSFFSSFEENQKIGAHTLFLLDLDPSNKKFLTISEAISILLEIDKKKKSKIFTNKTLCIGVSGLGSEKQSIIAGSAEEVQKISFKIPPFCLIVPGKLHFMEEDFLKTLFEDKN